MRVFRGTRDTGDVSACMCKDQVYLTGAVDILSNRRHPACDLTLLFAGRLALAVRRMLEAVIAVVQFIMAVCCARRMCSNAA